MLQQRARSKRGAVIRVFLLAFLAYAYFMPRWADWNIDSRIDLVHAIVDQHSLKIDAYHYNTWDKAVYLGHYYSDKAPGTATLGAVAYAAYVVAKQAPILGGGIRRFLQNNAWNVPIALGQTSTQKSPAPKGTNLGGCQRTGVAGNVQYIPWGNRLVPPMRDWALSKYVTTVAVVGFLSALFIAFFFWFLGFFTRVPAYRWILTGLYALCTVALPYSTVFYSHQLTAAFLFVGFALIFLLQRRLVGSWAAVVAGFLLGFSVFTEYTIAPIVLLIGLYGLRALWGRSRHIVAAAAAGAIPIIGLLVYNYAAFGNALDTGYSHDFCWSAAQGAGIAGFTYPQLGPLTDLTFGAYRGLFYLSPFLLLAIPGMWLMARRGLRIEALLCIISSAGFILLISAYWGWNGGRVEGPRYLVPIVPFLALPIIFFFDRWLHANLARIVTALLAAWSAFAIWSEFLGGAQFPVSWWHNPIFQWSLPALARNDIAPNAGYFLGLTGWQSLIPLLVLLLALGTIRSSPRTATAKGHGTVVEAQSRT